MSADYAVTHDYRSLDCSAGRSSKTSQRFYFHFLIGASVGRDEEQSTSATEWTLLHVVHLVIEASTFYSAIAKGAAAAALLSKADRDLAVDDCQPIYDLDEEPAPQLADKWPSLPAATRIKTNRGAQLQVRARPLGVSSRINQQYIRYSSALVKPHWRSLGLSGEYVLKTVSRLYNVLINLCNRKSRIAKSGLAYSIFGYSIDLCQCPSIR